MFVYLCKIVILKKYFMFGETSEFKLSNCRNTVKDEYLQCKLYVWLKTNKYLR